MGRAGTATPSISWGGAGGFPSWDGAAGCCGHHLGGKGSSLAPIWGVWGPQKGAGGLCQEETAPSSAEQPRAAGGREKTAPVRVNKHLPTARLGLFFVVFFCFFIFPFETPARGRKRWCRGCLLEGLVPGAELKAYRRAVWGGGSPNHRVGAQPLGDPGSGTVPVPRLWEQPTASPGRGKEGAGAPQAQRVHIFPTSTPFFGAGGLPGAPRRCVRPCRRSLRCQDKVQRKTSGCVLS